MKILFHSNAPWAGSGYGQQTALFARRFADTGHEVAISTNWGLQGAGLHWGDIPVYPGDNAWGNRSLPIIAAHHAGGDALGCQVIVLLDAHVLKQAKLADLHIAAWVPVDHRPCPPNVAAFFARTRATPIAMSRFGQEQLADKGLEPLYVPHGIDTSVFRPMPEGREEARRAMRIPPDAFVVGMVARNQGGAGSPSRKCFPQVFGAFARFARKNPDAVLYLHTDMFGFEDGLNLFAMAEACGIPRSALRWTHQGDIELGLVEQDRLAVIYSAFDVLANPSLGEGFGIPIIEAQACGVPVILNDHTAMPELCGAGWLVGGDEIYDGAHGAFFKWPSVAELVDAFEQAQAKRGKLAERARAFAVAYDADLVMQDYWVPALAVLEGKMEAGREVAPFDLAGRKT
jgi:glycosyltransferase involved in cell wall biosynthesis